MVVLHAALLAAMAISQAAIAPAPPATSATIHAEIQMAKDFGEVPFEFADHHIVFQVELGGERVWMLLDNGSSHNVIDVALAKRLGLSVIAMPGKAHATGGHDVPLQRVDDVSLVVPRAFSSRMPMVALDLSHIAFPGGHIQGILGHDLTSHLAILVDKRSGELVVSIKPVTMKGRIQPIAVATIGDRDQVHATVDGKPLTLTIDTGSASGLDLSPAAWARVRPRDAQIFARKSTGAAGVADEELASRLPAITIGSVTAADVDVRIAPQGGNDADGRIGMGLLSRYSFMLDTGHNQLWLIPMPGDTSTLSAPVTAKP